MKIFVTGANGFLGRHLVAALSAGGHDVTGPSAKDCDLTRPDSLDRFTSPFDQVWHLAAWTQAGDFCLHHPGEQWIINQHINTTVLDWWQRRQPQAKLVAIGTSCSYTPGERLREDRYLVGDPVPELYTYAMTKRMLLVGLQALAKQYGLRYLYLVPNTLFGPGYHLDGRQMHFIFDLMRKIVMAAIGGERAVLWGDGQQRREVVFVGDFVQAALRLVAMVDDDVVNVGTGEEYSIRWYVKRICALIGYDPALVGYDKGRYVGVHSKVLDVAKLRRLLPDMQWTSFDAGMRSTLNWYRQIIDP